MKYIIVEKMDAPLAVLFNEILQHGEVAQMTGGHVLSAGFCSITPIEGESGGQTYPTLQISVWGESVSLKVTSNPEEDEIYIRDAVIRR